MFFMKILLLSLILSFIFITSCSINGSFQGLFSYYKTTNNDNKITFIKSTENNNYCNNAYDSTTIVIINGTELKKCLSQNGITLVYIWSPRCNSAKCYPLFLLQDLCTKMNIELLVVAEYYDTQQMTKNHNLIRPIFGIDTKYYKSNFTTIYLNIFLQDLLIEVNHTTLKKIKYNNFFYFRNGIYVKSFNDIQEINQ